MQSSDAQGNSLQLLAHFVMCRAVMQHLARNHAILQQVKRHEYGQWFSAVYITGASSWDKATLDPTSGTAVLSLCVLGCSNVCCGLSPNTERLLAAYSESSATGKHPGYPDQPVCCLTAACQAVPSWPRYPFEECVSTHDSAQVLH